MCGRFKLASSAETLHAEFGIEPPAEHGPRYNIAPTQPLLAILPDGGSWRAATLHWGLVPAWETERSGAARRINARAETLLSKPSFRDAFLHRRCLILADGFYEWLKTGKLKTPVLIQRACLRPFAFAGIWEFWRQGDQQLYSAAIITVPSNVIVGNIHDRMPLILPRRAQETWLDPAATPDQLAALMIPYAGALSAIAVSPLVNSPANDSPDCILPCEPEPALGL